MTDQNNGDTQKEKINEDEQYVKKNFAEKLKEFAGKIPFVFDAVCLYYCAMDSRTPLIVKGVALGALAYFVLPTDLVPDILPFVGLIDDAGAIAAALGTIGSQITKEHRNQASEFLYGKPYEF